MRTLLLAVLAVPLAARAEPPSPEDIAKIQHEQEKAAADVDKKYGDRKPSELSPEERRAMTKEKAAADREVLEKHGVDPKEYARASAKQNLDDRARTRAAREKLKAD